VALLDPELTLGLPPAVTAATGIDAMVHAIEAFTSINPNNSPVSKALAREALALLGAHIRKAAAQGDDLAAREAMLLTLTTELSAAPIQHIGKLLVLWRPMPTREKPINEDRMAGPRDVKVLKYSKQSGQRPEVKTLRVLGNQRLTAGGQVKRAKPRKQISVKKRSQT
jgi:RNA-binding protein YhbY